jgi:flagellin FlaB
MHNTFLRNEKAITGLETAIILIAFVVVAAVFASTTLSAGLFATQKSQEVTFSGLKEIQSTLELRGSVIAKADTAGDNTSIRQVSFILANVLGGKPIDFTEPTANTTSNNGLAATNSSNKVVINYIDQDQTVNNLYWTVTKLGNANDNNMLEQNEKFEITIGNGDNSTGGGNLIDALNPQLSINKVFTLELLTPAGAVLTIERTTPVYIDQTMDLR